VNITDTYTRLTAFPELAERFLDAVTDPRGTQP
jgi:hypothetical protein